MNCVRPPLQKKPARGFGWACAPCNLAQERKLEALNAPHLHESASHAGTEDEEFPEEEEDDLAHADCSRTSPSDEDQHPPPTAEQIYQASLWPYRYLGIHCKIEDALDYDDRIYPRASSRLGPRHQATVSNWPGRPIEFVKPLEIKKSGRRDGRHSKEIQALIEKDKKERERRPKWVQDEPFTGYIPRGLDLPADDPNSTSTCLWKPATNEDGKALEDADGDIIISEAGIDDYMNKARTMWETLGVPKKSTNLEDIARDLLYKNKYNADQALEQLAKTDRKEFKEPDLTPVELKKFEEGVGKFGSELQAVKKLVKTVPHGMIVRFYYKWKKTPKGKQIWGNFTQRKGKKEIKKAQAEASKAADEVADDHDDSAFDTEKAKSKKKGFMCKFCNTKHSRQWRRAPQVTSAVVTETSNKSKDKGAHYVVALCRRCAELWRRYAVPYEDPDEFAKRVASSGGRNWKRKADEELLKELQAGNDRMSLTKYSTPEPAATLPPAAAAAIATANNAPTAVTTPQTTNQEPPRKKLKSERDPETVVTDAGSTPGAATTKKKEKEKDKDKDKDKEKEKEKEKERAVEKTAPPPPPPMPKPKTMPCAICRQLEPLGDQHLHCRECRMTVHRNCYGVIDNRHSGKWICDMCTNDKNPQNSLVRLSRGKPSVALVLTSTSSTTNAFCVQLSTLIMTLWNLPKSRIRRKQRRSVSVSDKRKSRQSRQPNFIASDRRSLDDRSFPENRSKRRPTTIGFTSLVPYLLQRSSSVMQRHSSQARGFHLSRGLGIRRSAKLASNKAVLAYLVTIAVLRSMSSVLVKQVSLWGSTLHQSRGRGEINTILSPLAVKAGQWPRSYGAKSMRPRQLYTTCKTWSTNPE